MRRTWANTNSKIESGDLDIIKIGNYETLRESHFISKARIRQRRHISRQLPWDGEAVAPCNSFPSPTKKVIAFLHVQKKRALLLSSPKKIITFQFP